MMLDHKSVGFHQFRNRAESVVLPVQKLVDTPIHLVRWIGSSMSSQQQLIEDNAELRAHQLLLQSKLHQMLLLERENNQLKELLQSTEHVQGKVKIAQLLSISLDPLLNEVVLNKGKTAGVTLGQPVMDAYGILGQVVGLDAYTSKVLLIADKHFAVPVLDQRSGVRAVAVGMGRARQLKLIHVLSSHDIKPGDLFVTSGLGLQFPEGYPVGVVSAIKPVPGSHELLITLDISAHLDQSQQVLLAWPDHAKLQQAVLHQLHQEKTDDNHRV